MSDTVSREAVRGALLALFDEIMTTVKGYTLDKGDALFETLASVTAAEASRPVSGQSASLAAQVNHIRFYIDAVLDEVQGADWDGSWKVGAVTATEWQALIERLHTSAARARTFMETYEAWDERYLGGAIALNVHCAYHLGEIRQGIGVLRKPLPPV